MIDFPKWQFLHALLAGRHTIMLQHASKLFLQEKTGTMQKKYATKKMKICLIFGLEIGYNFIEVISLSPPPPPPLSLSLSLSLSISLSFSSF